MKILFVRQGGRDCSRYGGGISGANHGSGEGGFLPFMRSRDTWNRCRVASISSVIISPLQPTTPTSTRTTTSSSLSSSSVPLNGGGKDASPPLPSRQGHQAAALLVVEEKNNPLGRESALGGGGGDRIRRRRGGRNERAFLPGSFSFSGFSSTIRSSSSPLLSSFSSSFLCRFPRTSVSLFTAVHENRGGGRPCRNAGIYRCYHHQHTRSSSSPPPLSSSSSSSSVSSTLDSYFVYCSIRFGVRLMQALLVVGGIILISYYLLCLAVVVAAKPWLSRFFSSPFTITSSSSPPSPTGSCCSSPHTAASHLPIPMQNLDEWVLVEPALREGDILLMSGTSLVSTLITAGQLALSKFGYFLSPFLYSHVAVVVAPARWVLEEEWETDAVEGDGDGSSGMRGMEEEEEVVVKRIMSSEMVKDGDVTMVLTVKGKTHHDKREEGGGGGDDYQNGIQRGKESTKMNYISRMWRTQWKGWHSHDPNKEPKEEKEAFSTEGKEPVTTLRTTTKRKIVGTCAVSPLSPFTPPPFPSPSSLLSSSSVGGGTITSTRVLKKQKGNPLHSSSSSSVPLPPPPTTSCTASTATSPSLKEDIPPPSPPYSLVLITLPDSSHPSSHHKDNKESGGRGATAASVHRFHWRREGAVVMEAMVNTDSQVKDIHGDVCTDCVQCVYATDRLWSKFKKNGKPAYDRFAVRHLLRPEGTLEEAERNGRKKNGVSQILDQPSSCSSSTPCSFHGDGSGEGCGEGLTFEEKVRSFAAEHQARPLDTSLLYFCAYLSHFLHHLLRPLRLTGGTVSCSELIVELYQQTGVVQRKWEWVPLSSSELAALHEILPCLSSDLAKTTTTSSSSTSRNSNCSSRGTEDKETIPPNTITSHHNSQKKKKEIETMKDGEVEPREERKGCCDGSCSLSSRDYIPVTCLISHIPSSEWNRMMTEIIRLYQKRNTSPEKQKQQQQQQEKKEVEEVQKNLDTHQGSDRNTTTTTTTTAMGKPSENGKRNDTERISSSLSCLFPGPCKTGASHWSVLNLRFAWWPVPSFSSSPPFSSSSTFLPSSSPAVPPDRQEKPEEKAPFLHLFPLVSPYSTIDSGEVLHNPLLRGRCQGASHSALTAPSPFVSLLNTNHHSTSSAGGQNAERSDDDNTNRRERRMEARRKRKRSGRRRAESEGNELSSSTAGAGVELPSSLRAGDIARGRDGLWYQVRWRFRHPSLCTCPFQFTDPVDHTVLDYAPGYRLGPEVRMQVHQG